MDGGTQPAAGIRGEVSATVCGRVVSLAPTYQALELIEQRLGVGIPALLMRSMSGDIRLRDLVTVVHEGLRGAGHVGKNGQDYLFSREQIGEDVCERFSDYAEVVGKFLGNALGRPLAKKAQAAEAADPSLQG